MNTYVDNINNKFDISDDSSKLELQYALKYLSISQKNFLINLLNEEREIVLPFIEHNMYAANRVNTINSIISALDQ